MTCLESYSRKGEGSPTPELFDNYLLAIDDVNARWEGVQVSLGVFDFHAVDVVDGLAGTSGK